MCGSSTTPASPRTARRPRGWPGVARQYSGTLGTVANCQIAVSVHAASEQASAVLDWRLFLPTSWDQTCLPDPDGHIANPYLRRHREDPLTLGVAGAAKVKLRKPPPTVEQITARRHASKIPEAARYAPTWRLALDMLDQLTAWGHTPPVLVADAGYGQVGAFRGALTARGIRYVVATTATTTAHPGHATPQPQAYIGTGRRPRPPRPGCGPPAAASPPTPTGPTPSCGCPVGRPGRHRTVRLLAVHPAPRHPPRGPGPQRQGPLAHRRRLPRTPDRPRPGPLRRPLLVPLGRRP